VSLPHMQGNLSASPEQITWVLTSFMVAQAVATPIVGWLAGRLGAKVLFLGSVAAFTATSVLCGLAAGLPDMVAFRVLQGLTGAALIPLGQAILLDISPPERLGRTMALYSTSTMLAPLMGPVLGAYLTEHLSWRWCFYINLPAGVVAFLLLWVFMPREKPKPRRLDFLGYGSLALAVACLQLVLDRGTSRDWFASPEIVIESVLAAAGLWIYVTHTLTAKHPLFDPRLARDRNFVLASAVFVVFSILMFASITLAPLMMQGVMGYPVVLSGLVSVPRGLVVLVVMQIVGRLDRVLDRRAVIATGLTVLAFTFWLMSHFDLDMSPGDIAFALALQGLGQGMMNVPLSTLMFATLPSDLRAEGSSLSNLVRTMGGSSGIAMMTGLIVTNQQRMHESLAAHVRPDDPVVRAGLGAAFSSGGVQSLLRLDGEVARQAAMVAYVDGFRAMALLAICAAPLLLLLRPARAKPPPA
jgi:DHA2 family multidrug resistance protein